MRKIKVFAAGLLTFFTLFCVSGCSFRCVSECRFSKDEIIGTFDGVIQSVGRLVLTEASGLQGKKKEGIDVYTGSYSADYDNFNGKEFLFGGTALSRSNGGNLTVKYSLTIESGSASLLWLNTGEQRIISEKSSEGTYSMTINAGSNYIVMQGDNFSGRLEVSVEDDES